MVHQEASGRARPIVVAYATPFDIQNCHFTMTLKELLCSILDDVVHITNDDLV